MGDEPTPDYAADAGLGATPDAPDHSGDHDQVGQDEYGNPTVDTWHADGSYDHEMLHPGAGPDGVAYYDRHYGADGHVDALHAIETDHTVDNAYDGTTVHNAVDHYFAGAHSGDTVEHEDRETASWEVGVANDPELEGL